MTTHQMQIHIGKSTDQQRQLLPLLDSIGQQFDEKGLRVREGGLAARIEARNAGDIGISASIRNKALAEKRQI